MYIYEKKKKIESLSFLSILNNRNGGGNFFLLNISNLEKNCLQTLN